MPTETQRLQAKHVADKLADREMVLELNFVPSWARKPASEVRYVLPHERPREHRRQRQGASGYSKAGSRRDSHKRIQPRPPARQPRRRALPASQPRPAAMPPFNVRFLPERKALHQIVRKLRRSRRFYPLMDIASLFLSQPDSCFVRLEPDGSAEDRFIYQCRSCGIAALEREAILSHILKTHFEETFVIEQTSCDPPAGNFVCIARCGLSGELLAPPNHNSYQDRIREMQLSLYPDMSLAEYEAHVETIHDPALIEEWKKQSSRQARYVLKNSGHAEALTALEAKALFADRIAPKLIARVRTLTLPSQAARRTQDPFLMRLLTDGWRRENRFPRSLFFALRGAFRHQGLHLFKTGKGIVFVGSVQPSPLDTEHVVEPLQEVLLYLREHPGCTRRDLVKGLRGGAAEDSEDARNVLSPLSWLIEKGHIIDFFDGTLSVPMGPGRRSTGRTAGRTAKRQ